MSNCKKCGCTQPHCCCPPNSSTPTYQTLTLSEDGQLSISNGNSVDICQTVKDCETLTQVYNLRLVGNVLELTYIGEDEVPVIKPVDLGGLSISASGTTIDVDDTNTLDLNLIDGILSGNVRIDPESTVPISASSEGLLIDCCPETLLSVTDTNTIDLIVTGTANHSLTANLKYADSSSINFGDSGSGFTGAVKISNDPDNILVIDGSGLLVPSDAFSALISGIAPIDFDSLTGEISIAQANGSTNGYLTSADWTTFNGKVNNGANLGTGARVFKQKSGTDLQFRTIKVEGGLSIIEAANEITLSASGVVVPDELDDLNDVILDNPQDGQILIFNGTHWVNQNSPTGNVGDITGGTNLGSSGGRIFAQKNGNNLEFRRVVAGTNVTINETANSVVINAANSSSSASGELNEVIVLDELQDLIDFAGDRKAIIVAETENLYLPYSGSEDDDNHVIIEDAASQKWKIKNVDKLTIDTDSIYSLQVNKIIDTIVVKNAVGLSDFSLGTSSGGEELLMATPIPAGTAYVFKIGAVADGGDLVVHINGITSETTLKIYKL